MRDAILSVNEKEFILRVRALPAQPLHVAGVSHGTPSPQALHEDQRTDGRRPFESRSPKFQARLCGSGVCNVEQANTP